MTPPIDLPALQAVCDELALQLLARMRELEADLQRTMTEADAIEARNKTLFDQRDRAVELLAESLRWCGCDGCPRSSCKCHESKAFLKEVSGE